MINLRNLAQSGHDQQIGATARAELRSKALLIEPVEISRSSGTSVCRPAVIRPQPAAVTSADRPAPPRDDVGIAVKRHQQQ